MGSQKKTRLIIDGDTEISEGKEVILENDYAVTSNLVISNNSILNLNNKTLIIGKPESQPMGISVMSVSDEIEVKSPIVIKFGECNEIKNGTIIIDDSLDTETLITVDPISYLKLTNVNIEYSGNNEHLKQLITIKDKSFASIDGGVYNIDDLSLCYLESGELEILDGTFNFNNEKSTDFLKFDKDYIANTKPYNLIVIRGGKFKGFDPRNIEHTSESENEEWNGLGFIYTNLYEVNESNGYYVVSKIDNSKNFDLTSYYNRDSKTLEFNNITLTKDDIIDLSGFEPVENLVFDKVTFSYGYGNQHFITYGDNIPNTITITNCPRLELNYIVGLWRYQIQYKENINKEDYKLICYNNVIPTYYGGNNIDDILFYNLIDICKLELKGKFPIDLNCFDQYYTEQLLKVFDENVLIENDNLYIYPSLPYQSTKYDETSTFKLSNYTLEKNNENEIVLGIYDNNDFHFQTMSMAIKFPKGITLIGAKSDLTTVAYNNNKGLFGFNTYKFVFYTLTNKTFDSEDSKNLLKLKLKVENEIDNNEINVFLARYSNDDNSPTLEETQSPDYNLVDWPRAGIKNADLQIELV